MTLIIGECRVVIHPQTLSVILAGLLLILTLSALTALAAAAAARTAEVKGWCHQAVPWRQWAKRPGQEVPASQQLRQELRAMWLQDVDDHDAQDEHHNGHTHADQDLPAGDGQAEHGEWDDEKAQNQVDNGKPAVFGCVVAQALSQADGHACERDGIPEDDPKNVEEEVAQGYLESGLHTIQYNLLLETFCSCIFI